MLFSVSFSPSSSLLLPMMMACDVALSLCDLFVCIEFMGISVVCMFVCVSCCVCRKLSNVYAISFPSVSPSPLKNLNSMRKKQTYCMWQYWMGRDILHVNRRSCRFAKR